MAQRRGSAIEGHGSAITRYPTGGESRPAYFFYAVTAAVLTGRADRRNDH